MRMSTRWRDTLILGLLSHHTKASEVPTVSYSDSRRPHHAIETGTCEAQIVDYVTHTLQPVCLPSVAQTKQITTTLTSSGGSEATATGLVGSEGDEGSIADGAGAPFMSFEDWKEEMLKRTGQDPQELRTRKANDPRKPSDGRIPEDGGTAWGDEEEIELDFGEYMHPQSHNHENGEDDTARGMEEYGHDSAIAYDHGKGFLHRSKDAGKTCKERFSYSSFDAGATILKTSSGTKNAKAILVENKDSYMLFECGRENKFVIVELSDDILLDTVVIANFEFFSSMIRHFRISVSDRYPVKVDKWKELGTFEARNSRDIQAFLVENPQIWAKYIRIEFLTHYGNEYYCPVSLIRIHGTRMLDSWKETDGAHGEDSAEDDDREARQCEDLAVEINTTDASSVSVQESQITEQNLAPAQQTMTSMDLFAIFEATCPALPTQLTTAGHGRSVDNITGTGTDVSSPTHHRASKEVEPASSGDIASTPDRLPASSGSQTPQLSAQQTSDPVRSPTNIPASTEKAAGDQIPPAESPSVKGTPANQPPKQPQSGSSGARSRGNPTSNAASASPTVQEGFFNSITKRLVQVESNLTLSMKYVEDQSRHIQEAMQRMEQKQSQRIALALDTLNSTVTSELHTMREQYEQLWQFTLRALENQRERNEQVAVALSARLNLLADEVVFQKRMAIAQAVLLLSCLFLVIFSRGVPLPYLAHPQQVGEHNSGLASSQTPTSAAHCHATVSPDAPLSSNLPSVRLMTPESTIGDALMDEDTFAADNIGSHPRADSSYHGTYTRFYRPSPPLTPRTHTEDELKYSELGTEGGLPRLPASDQLKSRKPLPALPEHP